MPAHRFCSGFCSGQLPMLPAVIVAPLTFPPIAALPQLAWIVEPLVEGLFGGKKWTNAVHKPPITTARPAPIQPTSRFFLLCRNDHIAPDGAMFLRAGKGKGCRGGRFTMPVNRYRSAGFQRASIIALIEDGEKRRPFEL